jgi:hypothetical protein
VLRQGASRMSALGHKRTFRSAIVMSALGYKRTYAVQKAMAALPLKATWDAFFSDVARHILTS